MQALIKVLVIVGCFITFTDITVRKRITFYDRTHFIWYNYQKRKKGNMQTSKKRDKKIVSCF